MLGLRSLWLLLDTPYFRRRQNHVARTQFLGSALDIRSFEGIEDDGLHFFRVEIGTIIDECFFAEDGNRLFHETEKLLLRDESVLVFIHLFHVLDKLVPIRPLDESFAPAEVQQFPEFALVQVARIVGVEGVENLLDQTPNIRVLLPTLAEQLHRLVADFAQTLVLEEQFHQQFEVPNFVVGILRVGDH